MLDKGRTTITCEVYGQVFTCNTSSYANLDGPEYRDHTIVARDSDDDEYMGTFPSMAAFRKLYPGAEIVSCIEEGNTLRIWC